MLPESVRVCVWWGPAAGNKREVHFGGATAPAPSQLRSAGIGITPISEFLSSPYLYYWMYYDDLQRILLGFRATFTNNMALFACLELLLFIYRDDPLLVTQS
jgi:hypothetical protein